MLDSAPTVVGIGRDLLGRTEQVRTVQYGSKLSVPISGFGTLKVSWGWDMACAGSAVAWRLAHKPNDIYTVAIKLQITIILQPHLAAHGAIEPANLNRWVVSIPTTMEPMFGALKKSGYVWVGASLAGVFALCFTETARDWSLCARHQVLFTHDSPLYDTHVSHEAMHRTQN